LFSGLFFKSISTLCISARKNGSSNAFKSHSRIFLGDAMIVTPKLFFAPFAWVAPGRRRLIRLRGPRPRRQLPVLLFFFGRG